jgi:nitroreductase
LTREEEEDAVPSLRDLVLRNRSYRRFDESHRIERETLVELVGLARCTASATNRQPLKYLLSADPERNDRIFPCLYWAAYLQDWKDPPPESARPPIVS